MKTNFRWLRNYKGEVRGGFFLDIYFGKTGAYVINIENFPDEFFMSATNYFRDLRVFIYRRS